MNMINKIRLDAEPRKQLMRIMPELNSYTEMSESQSAFLCGVLEWKKPQKILEIGIAAGGTSAIVMKCMEQLGDQYIMYPNLPKTYTHLRENISLTP